MDKYIATKPVRFDRNYAVGEEIPPHAIHPNVIKRLIEAGKIQRVPEEAPQQNLLGGSLEESVAFVENLLGITYDDPVPDLDERAKICKGRIVELEMLAERVAAEENKLQDDAGEEPKADADSEGNQPGTDDPKQNPDGEGAPSSPEGDAQPPADDSEGGGGNVIPPTDETKHDDPQDGAEGNHDGAPFVCPICGKICSTKTALIAHEKTHNK